MNVEKKMAHENAPIILHVKPGNYMWCSCGESKKQPFCDGSHGPTGMRPLFVEITEEKTIAWCGCKMSAHKPFCDGSHKRIT
jgi:CDGSH-type Zn-finger protein